MSVLNKWEQRLGTKARFDTVSGSPFLTAFKDAIVHGGAKGHSDGSRVELASALEAGIAATVLALLKTERDSPCQSVTTEIAGLTEPLTLKKHADVSFHLSDMDLVFEVKTALEFNSLAAAIGEAQLFKIDMKSGARKKRKLEFVLFSLAGKGGYDNDKASKVAEHILPGAIDRIFVLTLEAGKPGAKDEELVWRELCSSIRDFEKYIRSLRKLK